MQAAALARRAGLEPATAGLLCQLFASAFLPGMAIVVKLAGQHGVPVMEIVLARSLILLALVTGMLAREGDKAAWPWRSKRLGLLLLRGVLGMCGITGLYVGVQILPVSAALVLGLLSPVFLALAAPALLGEPTSRGVWAMLPLCAVGVVLVAQPPFLFGSRRDGGGGGGEALSMVGVAVGISQAGVVAAAKLTVRALGKTEPVATIIFSIAACATVFSAALCALLPRHFVLPASPAVWALLAAAGLLACGVQLLSTLALKLSPATPVVLVSYVSVVWGLLADLAVFHHRPSALGLLGAALVCASSCLIALLGKRDSSSGGGSDGGAADGGSAAAGLKAKRGIFLEADAAAAAAYWPQREQQGGRSSADSLPAELAEAGTHNPEAGTHTPEAGTHTLPGKQQGRSVLQRGSTERDEWRQRHAAGRGGAAGMAEGGLVGVGAEPDERSPLVGAPASDPA